MRCFITGWRRGLAGLGRPALAGLAALTLSGAPLRADVTSSASNRVALVIGEGAYRGGPLPAAPDDAGLVAQVLAGAGFDVTGARDLDGDGMRRAFRDFLDKAATAGPDGIAVVYVAGRAIQSDGDDFLVPVDARLARPADVAIETLRLADFTHALAALPIQARIVIVDGAYGGGSTAGHAATAPGLSLMEAEQGELLAFNAAPGTVAPPTAGPYGAYAQALVAALKQGGVPVGEVFARVRLAVNQATNGAVIPWDSDKLTRSFSFFDRAPDAPALASAQIPFAALEKRPLRDFPADQAYDVAVARDTLPAYAEFLSAFPDDPLARRVRLIVALRREALFWRAAVQGNAPGAYWTYLVRYPKGPHAADARRRLARLAAAAAPPPRFVPIAFDVPPPGPDDVPFDRVIVFDAPGLPPPPPPPVFLLPPPVEIVIERPAGPAIRGLLPVPVPVAIPHVRPPVDPGSIAPPRGAGGSYPHPRPYARGPNGNGLVVQAAPAPAAPAPAAPAPAAPAPAAPAAVDLPPPAAPGALSRPAGHSSDHGMPSRPGDRPTGGALPAPPAIAQPTAPASAPLPVPAAPTAPLVKPVTGPVQPHAPVAPVLPASPAGRPDSAPAGAPANPRPGPRDHPAAPNPAAPPAPAATPPTPPGPQAERPAAHQAPHHPPVGPAAAPAQAAKPDAAPQPEPKRNAPSVPASSAPQPLPAPVRPPGDAARPEPAGRRAPPPDHPPAGGGTKPAAPDRAAPGAPRAPGEHSACGHPGEPPCRP